MSLAAALQRPTTYEGISFYGYVASQYPGGKHAEFEFDVWPMNEEQLAREALEQHYTISHIVHAKSRLVTFAAY